MKKILVLGAVAMALVVGGCKNKNKEMASTPTPALTEVAPPPMQAYTSVTPAYEPIAQYPADPAPATGKSYTVKKGDTLWSIAQRSYGDGKQYKKIVAANPGIKGDRVNAGQSIIIP